MVLSLGFDHAKKLQSFLHVLVPISVRNHPFVVFGLSSPWELMKVSRQQLSNQAVK